MKAYLTHNDLGRIRWNYDYDTEYRERGNSEYCFAQEPNSAVYIDSDPTLVSKPTNRELMAQYIRGNSALSLLGGIA